MPIVVKPVFDSKDSSGDLAPSKLSFVRHLLAPQARLFYNTGFRFTPHARTH
jgi:hypothetical protein